MLRYAGGAPVLANPNRVQLERIDPAQPLADALRRDVPPRRCRPAEVAARRRRPDAARDLAAVRQRGDAEGPRRPAAALSVHARHAHPRPDPRSRRAHLARLLPAQEPARADDRGRRTPAPARRERRAAAPASTGGGATAAGITEQTRSERDAASAGRRQRRSGAGGRARDRARHRQRSRSARPNARPTTASAARLAREDRAAVARSQRTPAALFEELNWDYATIERLNPDLSTQVIAFNLGKAVLQGDEANNVALAPGDVVTVYSQKDVRVPVARQTRLVSLEGEVNAPGVYQLQPGETLQRTDRARRRLHAAGLCLRSRVSAARRRARASARTWPPRSAGWRRSRRCRRRATRRTGATTPRRRVAAVSNAADPGAARAPVARSSRTAGSRSS